MVRHRRSLLQRSAVLEVGGDAGLPETVIAELGTNAGSDRATADHRIGVRLRRHRAGELAGDAPDRVGKWPFRTAGQACAVEIGGEVFLEVVIARHRVPLPALLAAAP